MKKILLSSAIAMLVLTGCGEDKKTTAIEQTKEEVKLVDKEESTKTVAQEASKMMESVSKENIIEIKDDVKEAVIQTAEEVTQKVEKAIDEVKTTITPVKEETKIAIDAKALYAACASCHGLNAEKQALGKSQVIKGWDKQKLIDALNGYKDGSYGGAMKGLMKGQVATKSPEEIEALASFISNL